MTVLESPLKLTPQPDYRIVEVGPQKTRFFRFENKEILTLARFCYSRRESKPALSVVCDRNGDPDPVRYEGFWIKALAFSRTEASINLHRVADAMSLSLKFLPDRKSDPSGKIISYIEVPPDIFPEEKYLAFRNALLREQMATSRTKAIKPGAMSPL